MNWESFYLICFVVGVVLSALSLLGGMGRIGWHIHLPHGHVGHIPHAAHVPHGAAGTHAAGGRGTTSATVSWWNAFSIMIFLCWFGAAGFLLTRYESFVAVVVLVLATVCGLVGGAIIFLFLAKVLLPHERELTADETDVVGAVGRVSAPSGPVEPVKWSTSNWAHCGRLRHAPKTAKKFPNRKKSSSSATKKELPTSAGGTDKYEGLRDQGLRDYTISLPRQTVFPSLTIQPGPAKGPGRTP